MTRPRGKKPKKDLPERPEVRSPRYQQETASSMMKRKEMEERKAAADPEYYEKRQVYPQWDTFNANEKQTFWTEYQRNKKNKATRASKLAAKSAVPPRISYDFEAPLDIPSEVDVFGPPPSRPEPLGLNIGDIQGFLNEPRYSDLPRSVRNLDPGAVAFKSFGTPSISVRPEVKPDSPPSLERPPSPEVSIGIDAIESEIDDAEAEELEAALAILNESVPEPVTRIVPSFKGTMSSPFVTTAATPYVSLYTTPSYTFTAPSKTLPVNLQQAWEEDVDEQFASYTAPLTPPRPMYGEEYPGDIEHEMGESLSFGDRGYRPELPPKPSRKAKEFSSQPKMSGILERWGLKSANFRPELSEEEKGRPMSAELKDLVTRDKRVFAFWNVGPDCPLVEIHGTRGTPKFFINGDPTTLELFRSAIKRNRRNIMSKIALVEKVSPLTANRMLADYQAASSFVKIEEKPVATYDVLEEDLENKLTRASLNNDYTKTLKYSKALRKLREGKSDISRLTKPIEAVALPYNDINHKGYAYQELLSKKDYLNVLQANKINTVTNFDLLYTAINEYGRKMTNMMIALTKREPAPDASPLIKSMYDSVRGVTQPRDYAKVTEVDALFVRAPAGKDYDRESAGYTVTAAPPLKGMGANPNRAIISTEEGRRGEAEVDFVSNPVNVQELPPTTQVAVYPGGLVD